MSLPPISESAVIVKGDADDWRAAVRLAGTALVASGAAGPGYADEMIRMIEEHGPYVVIAPGLALAHARPGPDVLGDGLAIVTLRAPVPFGHPHNDPVSVILALAVSSIEGHLESIAHLANAFNDPSTVPDIAAADDVATIISIIEDRQ